MKNFVDEAELEVLHNKIGNESFDFGVGGGNEVSTVPRKSLLQYGSLIREL